MERLKPPEPGIYPDIPEETYRAWDAYNWSSLKRVKISLEQFKWDWDHPEDKDTPAKLAGRVLHDFLVDPDGATGRYAIKPAEYPSLVKAEGADITIRYDGDDGVAFIVARGRGKQRETWEVGLLGDGDEWQVSGTIPDGLVKIEMQPWSISKFCVAWQGRMEAEGRTILSEDMLGDSMGMARRLREVPDIQEFLEGAMFEVSMVWVDPQTKLTCKGRMDAWKGWLIGDIKSSYRPVDNDSFAWTVNKMGYAGQGAMYLDGLKAALKATGKAIDGTPCFTFWAVQSFKPYTPHPWHLLDNRSAGSYEWIEYGRQTWHSYLQQVAYALKHDHWPGHHHEGQPHPSSEELLVPGNMKLLPEEKLT